MNITRKEFLEKTGTAAAAVLLSSLTSIARQFPQGKVKVAVIGCGSVSRMYFPHLSKSPYVELVSACDIRYEREDRKSTRLNSSHVEISYAVFCLKKKKKKKNRKKHTEKMKKISKAVRKRNKAY